jgi:hypothetical protein
MGQTEVESRKARPNPLATVKASPPRTRNRKGKGKASPRRALIRQGTEKLYREESNNKINCKT